MMEWRKEWQLIETAPTNGMAVLIYADGFVSEAQYEEGEGWYLANTSSRDYYAKAIYPTHWMPLPAPPLEQPKQESPASLEEGDGA